MRKWLLVLLMALVPSASFASGYVIGDYGTGGKVKDSSYGIEVGGIFLSPLHPTGGAISIGVGVSKANSDEHPTSNEAPAGVTGPVSVKHLNDGDETEVHLALGAELVPALFAIVGVGYATQERVRTGVFSDGERYMLDSSREHYAAGIFGLRYVREMVNAGVGYDTRRGVMTSIGVAF